MKKTKIQQEKDKDTTKKSSSQLIKEITKAEGIISAIGDGISILDRTFKILYENQAHRDMMGVHVGEKCYKAYQKRQGICGGCPVALTFKDGMVHIAESELQTDKETKYMEITASPLKDSKGNIIAGIEVVRDITKRRKAEKDLHDSRHMMQILLDTTPAAVFWKDRNLNYLGGNCTWLEAVGLKSSEDVFGKSDYDLPWEKKQADSFRECDRRIMESGIPEYDIIEPYKRDDGTHAWAKTNKVPLRDKEGNIIGILGTYEDITERKRAEEAFKKKSDEQELLLDNIQTLIWYLTDSETHGIANKACADFIGKKKEDLENKKMYDIMPKEEAEVCIAGNKKVFKKKVPIHTEEWIKNAQGEKRLLSVTKTPKLDTNGNVEYIVCSGMDITKHKLREDKIRKSEDFIKTIFDSMDEIISVVNVHDYSIASINKAFADWTGMNFDEIIGRPCYEILYKKVNPCDDCCCPIREILNTGISSIIEQEQSKNGDKHYFEVSTTPIRNADGKIVQVLCVRKDITERKQAEDALKHKIFQIENLNNIFVGREMKMIELKKEINLLLEELGRPKEYM